jgi:hypothetical protein
MGNMIECDGPDCLVGWFHYSCVDVKVDLPDGNYIYIVHTCICIYACYVLIYR